MPEAECLMENILAQSERGIFEAVGKTDESPAVARQNFGKAMPRIRMLLEKEKGIAQIRHFIKDGLPIASI